MSRPVNMAMEPRSELPEPPSKRQRTDRGEVPILPPSASQFPAAPRVVEMPEPLRFWPGTVMPGVQPAGPVSAWTRAAHAGSPRPGAFVGNIVPRAPGAAVGLEHLLCRQPIPLESAVRWLTDSPVKLTVELTRYIAAMKALTLYCIAMQPQGEPYGSIRCFLTGMERLGRVAKMGDCAQSERTSSDYMSIICKELFKPATPLEFVSFATTAWGLKSSPVIQQLSGFDALFAAAGATLRASPGTYSAQTWDELATALIGRALPPAVPLASGASAQSADQRFAPPRMLPLLVSRPAKGEVGKAAASTRPPFFPGLSGPMKPESVLSIPAPEALETARSALWEDLQALKESGMAVDVLAGVDNAYPSGPEEEFNCITPVRIQTEADLSDYLRLVKILVLHYARQAEPSMKLIALNILSSALSRLCHMKEERHLKRRGERVRNFKSIIDKELFDADAPAAFDYLVCEIKSGNPEAWAPKSPAEKNSVLRDSLKVFRDVQQRVAQVGIASRVNALCEKLQNEQADQTLPVCLRSNRANRANRTAATPMQDRNEIPDAYALPSSSADDSTAHD